MGRGGGLVKEGGEMRFIKRTSLVWFMLVMVFALWIGGANGESKLKGTQYTVKKGDTLWDISQSFYGNPLYWPIIWDSNQQKVPNPHWIYPGEGLFIPHPYQLKAPAKAHAPKVPIKRRPLVPSKIILFSSYISSRPVSSPYTIGTSVYDPDKTIFNKYDKVTVLWKPGATPLQVGRYLIVGKGGKVKMPKSGKTVGWQVNCLGILRVDKVGDNKAQGTIETAAFPISNGDLIFPLKVPSPIYRFLSGPTDQRGIIVKLQGEKDVGALMDFVFVSLGVKEGIRPGMVLDVYSPQGVEEVVGKLVVLRAQDHICTCYLYNSRMPLEPGMEVRGGRVSKKSESLSSSPYVPVPMPSEEGAGK